VRYGSLWLVRSDSCVTRDLHGDGYDGNPAESAGNPREWVQLLREYRGDGTKTCGNTAGVFWKTCNHTVFNPNVFAVVKKTVPASAKSSVADQTFQ